MFYVLAVVVMAVAVIVNLRLAKAMQQERFSSHSNACMAYALVGGYWTTGIVAAVWWVAGAGTGVIIALVCAVLILPWMFGSQPRVQNKLDAAGAWLKDLRS